MKSELEFAHRLMMVSVCVLGLWTGTLNCNLWGLTHGAEVMPGIFPVRRVYAPWFCLVTTKIWSDGHLSPWCITALGSRTNRVIALRQISVTALFYLEDSRRTHPQSVRACQPKDAKRREWRSAPAHGRERERERALWLLFVYVSSSPWARPV